MILLNQELKKWILRLGLFSAIFVAVGFIRYYPVAISQGTTDLLPLGQPKGTDAGYYFQPLSILFKNPQDIGHGLTNLFSWIVRQISPDMLDGMALLGFFSLSFTWSAYYFIKHSWIVFLLTPFSLYIHRIATSGTYAQLFAITFFLVACGLWIRDREYLAVIPLVASFFAHFWTGAILLTVFIVYTLYKTRGSIRSNWKKILPVLTTLFVLCVIILANFGLYEKMVSYVLYFHKQGNGLFHCFLTNNTNLPSFGLIYFLVLGTITYWLFGEKNSDLIALSTVWFLTSFALMALFWGGLSFRIWMMLPFLFPACYGFDWAVENKYYEIITLGISVALFSGWFLGA